MAVKKNTSNIINRSPWFVSVRGRPELGRQFSYPKKAEADAYQNMLHDKGLIASVRQLETSFQLRIRRKGVRVQRITFDTYAAAEQALRKIESDLSVSIVRDYAIAAQTSFRDIADRYIAEVAPKHKGGEIEIGRLKKILRDQSFVDKPLAALRTEDLQDFIGERLADVRPATVDRDIDVISQTLRYASDVWKIGPAESPLLGLKRPKYFNERDRRLGSGDERRLLEAARADENEYIEPVIILAIETAMRRSEILSFSARDVDFDRRFILLRETKNGQSRKVPLTRRAMSVLRGLPDRGDAPLLKLTANAVKKAFFQRVLPAAGIADLHFHDLRHEAISRFAETGKFELIDLLAISGHRDPRMLQRYAHLCSKKLAQKMDGVEREDEIEEAYIHRGRKRTLRRKCDATFQVANGQAVEVEMSSENVDADPVVFSASVIDFAAIRARRVGGRSE
ncbi:site-specific integrase [Denitromonas ohlonensis]|uniref:Site-specific integrase n=2 Tax=Denitromonas TaxID=139331 RepID=A0A557RGF5_9RHOO|nr:site-specific integrase [Denitromonas ohlonensis]TVO76223.1 site-specific integrase [Denitromonas ohlonensis]